MNMNDKPAPAALECQSEIDKDLVRSYYGDLGAFYRVREALAATPAVGGEAVAVVRQMVEAYDSGNLQMSSPEIGEPENDIPIHPWHEELLHYARAALASQPAAPLRGREAVIEECARVADALTKKWGQPNGEDYNQGMNDHGIRIASNIRALASASPPEQPAADPFQPHENCNCLMCLAEKSR